MNDKKYEVYFWFIIFTLAIGFYFVMVIDRSMAQVEGENITNENTIYQLNIFSSFLDDEKNINKSSALIDYELSNKVYIEIPEEVITKGFSILITPDMIVK